jgi:hypothetical protein
MAAKNVLRLMKGLSLNYSAGVINIPLMPIRSALKIEIVKAVAADMPIP